jgi:hypothetical protein
MESPPPSVTPYPTRNIFPQDSSNLSKRFDKTSWGCQKEKENRVCNIELLFQFNFYICIRDRFFTLATGVQLRRGGD